MNTINPYTGQKVKSFQKLTSEQLSKKLHSAELAFLDFSTLDLHHKKQLLLNAGKELRKNKEHYAALITLEMGKVITQARAEIEKCAWVCDFYAENAEAMLSPKHIETDASESYVSYEPLGALLTIMPWNFPFWQFFRCAAPALMLGNTLLLKHASNVPQCALAIEEVFKKAGYNEHVMQTLLIDSSQVNEVIEHNAVKAVTLTGSEKAGSAVAATAGKNIKKVVLELGGSDPFIVFSDADIDLAIKEGVKSRFQNCGQSCIAAKRFIVHEEVYDTFLDKLSVSVKDMKIGDPKLEDTQIGPMARKDLAVELDKQVKESARQGAKVLCGGNMIDGDGAFFEPTILTDIPSSSPAYSEELFGPVASVYKFKELNEAITLANDTSFGLGASIWTSDVDKAKRIATRIQSGSVFINGLVKSDPRLPFGGVKNSGHGRELAHVGILEFANVKTVWIR